MTSAAPPKRRRRTAGPTRADLERACPELLECPHCFHWGVVKGYVCNFCDKDPGGKAMGPGREYR